MNTISKGAIKLTNVNDAYNIVVSPNSCIVKADFDGSNPNLDLAYTIITVCRDSVPISFSIQQKTLSDPSIKCNIVSIDNYSKKVILTSIPTYADSGSIELEVTTADGYNTCVTFQFSVVKESTMLDWIQEWNTNKTQIGNTYVVSPKMFVGKNIEGVLSGVYIGPDNNTINANSAGIYGYKEGECIFSINANGGYIGGWDITQNGIVKISTDENGVLTTLRISPEMITCEKGDGNFIWGLSNEGTATFSKGKAIFSSDGNLYIEGEIKAIGGSVANWEIYNNTLCSKKIVLDSALNYIGIATTTENKTTYDGETHYERIKNVGGVAMFGFSEDNYGVVAYASNKQVFSLGSVNKIASWNFNENSLFIGVEKNESKQYTDSSSYITIGTNGMRGSAWRLESDGSAAFSAGKALFNANGSGQLGDGSISWNTEGKVTIGQQIKIGKSNLDSTIIDGGTIVAGLVNASRINTGRLSSKDSKTYFDLDNNIICGNIKFISGNEEKEVASVINDMTTTIDSKNKIFTSQPTPPYKIGDMWVQGSEEDMLVCKTSRTASQQYNENDWVKAGKTADLSELEYLTNTFKDGSTEINGGVVLSHLIAVKDSSDNNNISALINGTPNAELGGTLKGTAFAAGIKGLKTQEASAVVDIKHLGYGSKIGVMSINKSGVVVSSGYSSYAIICNDNINNIFTKSIGCLEPLGLTTDTEELYLQHDFPLPIGELSQTDENGTGPIYESEEISHTVQFVIGVGNDIDNINSFVIKKLNELEVQESVVCSSEDKLSMSGYDEDVYITLEPYYFVSNPSYYLKVVSQDGAENTTQITNVGESFYHPGPTYNWEGYSNSPDKTREGFNYFFDPQAKNKTIDVLLFLEYTIKLKYKFYLHTQNSNSSGSGSGGGGGGSNDSTLHTCSNCGYQYDPEKGDIDNGISSGTLFEELSDDWTCPNCGGAKEQFLLPTMPYSISLMSDEDTLVEEMLSIINNNTHLTFRCRIPYYDKKEIYHADSRMYIGTNGIASLSTTSDGPESIFSLVSIKNSDKNILQTRFTLKNLPSYDEAETGEVYATEDGTLKIKQ